MARTITLRLSDTAYDAVQRWAATDDQSMNAWIETVLDNEDMRRRCTAHDRFMQDRPEQVAFAEAWSDRNLGDLLDR